MKKTLLYILTFAIFIANTTFADSVEQSNPDIKSKRQPEIDKMLDERLHLTAEQKAFLEKNRIEYREEMKKTVKRMEFIRKKIKYIYITQTNKIEADIKSTPLKIELALLKQQADKIRLQSRKNFENTLDNTQKIEFEKIKEELHNKKIQLQQKSKK